MARPRPVPLGPSVEPRACTKGSKMTSGRSAGMPGPLSSTSISRRSPSPSSRVRARRATPPLPGELHGIAQQVEQHLAQLAGIGANEADDLRLDLQGKGEPLGPGAGPSHLADLLQQPRQVERGGLQQDPARLDLGEIEDVVDHRQQVFAAAVDDPPRCLR